MPSYRYHVLFAILFTLPFFSSVFYVALAILGTSLVDLDYSWRNKNLLIILLMGIIITIMSYVLDVPLFLGLTIIFISFLFYLSKHRGFMHSLFGVLILSLIFSIVTWNLNKFLNIVGLDSKILIILVALILGFIILRKKILFLYVFFVVIGIIITSAHDLSFIYIFGAFFTGILSHVVLDLFTTSGVELLNPLSSHKFKKRWGLSFLLLWAFLGFYYTLKQFNLI